MLSVIASQSLYSLGLLAAFRKIRILLLCLSKDRLNKRKKLRKSDRVSEANLLANKINNLICESRKRCLSTVSEAFTRELWAAVKPTKHKTDCVSNILYNADAVNKFFADISTDPI